MAKRIQIQPVFVKTRNVRNFEVLMNGLDLGAGEGRLGLVHGRAGRGKTRTAQWYAAHNACIYIRMMTVWRTSELEFLKNLCRELGVVSPPHRKGPCFIEIIDRLLVNPRPIFLDEIEKLSSHFLDVVRDLADLAKIPVILIGEAELPVVMRRNARVWSRTQQELEFDPISSADIVYYFGESTGKGVNLSPKMVEIIEKASSGDFRLVRRALLNLIQIVNGGGDGPGKVTEQMVKIAVKTGLNG